MNEIKISNGNSAVSIPAIIAFVLLIAVICGGIVYYYRGADSKLESELVELERLNTELASATMELRSGVASHSEGLKIVRNEVTTSRKGIEHVYTEIGKATKHADRAIEIINECENIIEKIKTQK